MIRSTIVIASAFLLAGCATPFYNAQTAGPLLEQTSRLPPASLRSHSSCTFAFAAIGAPKADFIQGACAYSDTVLYLYSWDASKKLYRREIELPFTALKGVAKAKVLYTQLQTPVEGGQLVVETKGADALLETLLKAGVTELPAGKYVQTSLPPPPTTIYIPVYVGS
jgi:hypothetical protein